MCLSGTRQRIIGSALLTMIKLWVSCPANPRELKHMLPMYLTNGDKRADQWRVCRLVPWLHEVESKPGASIIGEKTPVRDVGFVKEVKQMCARRGHEATGPKAAAHAAGGR